MLWTNDSLRQFSLRRVSGYHLTYSPQVAQHAESRPYEYLMMTPSNGSIFRVTGHLYGEFTGPRWIPCTKASDAELWCFLWSASEYGWVNNREAGDLRRDCARYDVIVMCVWRCAAWWQVYLQYYLNQWPFFLKWTLKNKLWRHWIYNSSSMRFHAENSDRYLRCQVNSEWHLEIRISIEWSYPSKVGRVWKK